jgi:hypothetical protein
MHRRCQRHGSAFSFRLAAALCVLPLGHACSPRGIPVSISSTDPNAPTPPAPDVILLFSHPRQVFADVLHPPGIVQQSLTWTDLKKTQWRFVLPADGYAYAGFGFYKSHNVIHGLGEYALTITLSPAHMTRHLWIGLVDGERQPPSVVVDLPLARYTATTRGKGPTKISIPLRDFPRDGSTANNGGDVDRTFAYPFDWGDLAGIRLISQGGKIPVREVIVNELLISR